MHTKLFAYDVGIDRSVRGQKENIEKHKSRRPDHPRVPGEDRVRRVC